MSASRLLKFENPTSLTDLEICCDGGSLYFCKFTLATTSAYFRAMFTNGMSQTRSSMIKIPEKREYVRDMLYYIARSTSKFRSTVLNVDNVGDLLDMSEKYLLYSLKSDCSDFLRNHIEEIDIIDIINYSFGYNIRLKSIVIGIFQRDKKSHKALELASNPRVGELVPKIFKYLDYWEGMMKVFLEWIRKPGNNKGPRVETAVRYGKWDCIPQKYIPDIIEIIPLIDDVNAHKCLTLVVSDKTLKPDERTLSWKSVWRNDESKDTDRTDPSDVEPIEPSDPDAEPTEFSDTTSSDDK